MLSRKDLMEVETLLRKSTNVNDNVIRAREIIIQKMEKALVREKQIMETDVKRREEEATKTYNKLKGEGYTVPTADYIKNYFGKAPYVDDKLSLLRFVNGVDEVYKNQFNIKALEKMIENAKNIVQKEKVQNAVNVKKVNVINIIYRNGIIRPKKDLGENEAGNYHWEIKTKYQPWGKLKAKNSRPNISEGLIRLHYRGNECISNVVDIQTVIRRQAFTAKRQQFRFKKTDTEFKQRCQGVAHRILRLTTPHIIRHGLSNGYSMRIFQDRVSRLPQHLDKNVQEILQLCKTKLSNKGNITPREADYIKMVEFCEPTIHLNPAGMRRELADIKLGKKIKLQMYEDSNLESDNSSSEEESEESSEESSGESSEESSSSSEEEKEEEEDDDDLSAMKMKDLKKLANEMKLENAYVGKFGSRTKKATYIDAIKSIKEKNKSESDELNLSDVSSNSSESDSESDVGYDTDDNTTDIDDEKDDGWNIFVSHSTEKDNTGNIMQLIIEGKDVPLYKFYPYGKDKQNSNEFQELNKTLKKNDFHEIGTGGSKWKHHDQPFIKQGDVLLINNGHIIDNRVILDLVYVIDDNIDEYGEPYHRVRYVYINEDGKKIPPPDRASEKVKEEYGDLYDSANDSNEDDYNDSELEDKMNISEELDVWIKEYRIRGPYSELYPNSTPPLYGTKKDEVSSADDDDGDDSDVEYKQGVTYDALKPGPWNKEFLAPKKRKGKNGKNSDYDSSSSKDEEDSSSSSDDEEDIELSSDEE